MNSKSKLTEHSNGVVLPEDYLSMEDGQTLIRSSNFRSCYYCGASVITATAVTNTYKEPKMQVTISGCKFAVNDNTALIDCEHIEKLRNAVREGLSRIGIKLRDSYIVATKESKTSIYFIIDPVNTPMNQEDEERMLSSLSETINESGMNNKR